MYRPSLAFRPGDVAVALALLTRLPVPADHGRGARAAWAWPLAGAVVGGLAALAAGATTAIGAPPAVAAGAALATSVVVTGAMHEDGLADTADGFWGGWSPARRLAIMSDSSIGTYGVMALILVTGLRWAAIAALIGTGTGGIDVSGETGQWRAAAGPLVAAAACGRATMAVLSWRLKHARDTGLAVRTGRVRCWPALTAIGLAAGLALLALGWWAALALAAAAGAAIACAVIARAKIGGHTGDVLGAAGLLAEVAMLVSLATL